MIQFIIVAVIVGGFTAYFFGVPASLKVGEGLISVWIIAGLALTLLEPLLSLLKLLWIWARKLFVLCDKISTRITKRV